jgi:glycerol-3-phosphate dehydrogenase
VSDPRHDLVVVGAGIHGAGVAQAAAAMGHSVLILERECAPARWTSSRSSKLIHGGLRYLETGQFALVRECLRERALLLRNAPGLVRLIPFHLPLYADSRRAPWQLGLGLSAYALLGGLGRSARFARIPRRDWTDLDGLRGEGLRAVFRYYDGQTDDAALTHAVLASATRLGAQLQTGMEVQRIRLDEDTQTLHCRGADGAVVHRAGLIVNAAGPWVGTLTERVEPARRPLPLQWVAGTHLLLDDAPRRGGYYVESPLDGRPVFVLPWQGRTLVGTTERAHAGPPETVAASAEEVEYLLATFRHHFPQRRVRALDRFAGLRVLPQGDGAAGARSRDTRLDLDDPQRPRFVSIYGGKLTAYRATAERLLRLCTPALPRRGRPGRSRRLRLGESPGRP